MNRDTAITMLRRVLSCFLPSLMLLAALAPASADDRAERLMQTLVDVYPDFLAGHEANAILWKDGTRMSFDDGKGDKTFEERLDHPDLEDEFYAPYPPGRAGLSPAPDIDPGRVRFEPFFLKMYGDCKKDGVAKRLRKVTWMPRHGGGGVMFTTENGADRHLAAAIAELDALPDSFMKYLVPSAGAYVCRPIAGTSRLSMHAYGAAIDISTRHTDYWRWNKPGPGGRYPYKNQVPWEIVEIFERHGFIWGGKWHHYDTMHFEYRPEMLR